MGGVFSSSSASKPNKKIKSRQHEISEYDRAILDLKNARDRLQRYRTKLETEDAKLLEQAKAAKAARKTTRALGLLRLRKYKTEQAKGVEEQLLNVLTMVETIDSKQNEKAVLEAMKVGKDSLQKMHQETTVEDVLKLMDDIAEEHAVEQEITNILQSVPELSAEQESELEQELAAMEAEINGTTTTTTNEVPELPTAPTTALPSQQEAVQQQPAAASSKPERVAVPG